MSGVGFPRQWIIKEAAASLISSEFLRHRDSILKTTKETRFTEICKTQKNHKEANKERSNFDFLLIRPF
jgi:hypothetical protein